MKTTCITLTLFLLSLNIIGQNQNISNGNIFDGEPYLSINPSNSQHMVVAWMGYLPFSRVYIKTKVSFNAGQTWSAVNNIPHVNPAYGSADPSIEFDNSGNVFICYIDYSQPIDSGAIYIVKSTDGGLNWGNPVEALDAHADPGKYPVDRPWMSIDRSGGANDGNIYITSMPPKVFGPLPPPYHPYVVTSTNGGASFTPWRYLDTTNWLAGNLIPQPMPTNCVSANGTFHNVYPSYMASQSLFARYIIGSSTDATNSFNYNTVMSSASTISDTLAKKGYLLRTNPANANHLAFFYLDITHGDMDVYVKESFDEGVNWSAATRVNDDPIANNRMQDLLWADFDTDGDLIVSWRDRRNGTDSTYTTSSEIWGAFRSKDSTNFAPNFQISDTNVPYDTILSYSGNDFMCIKLVDDTLSAVWGDTRNGSLNIWFQRMTTSGVVISTNQISSESIPNINIYPNPTVNEITIESKGLKQVIVFNQVGKKVANYEDLKSANQLKIDLSKLAKGTYFIQVSTADGMTIEKIIKQ